MDNQELIQEIASSLAKGAVIPYMGPEMLSLCSDVAVPATPLALAESMTAKVSVPHKIRKRLTQTAQFIENFKHRKSVVHLMNEAFATSPAPSNLQLALANSGAKLWVDCWYDDSFSKALAQGNESWVQVQGLSQSEHFGQWTGAYAADGTPLAELSAEPGRMLTTLKCSPRSTSRPPSRQRCKPGAPGATSCSWAAALTTSSRAASHARS